MTNGISSYGAVQGATVPVSTDTLSTSKVKSTESMVGAVDPAKAITAATQDTLGQDAFLKLLMAQMKYQDPMSPLKNQEFVAQMAQFSSVEQLTSLNSNFSDWQKSQSNNSETQALLMLGQEVSGISDEGGSFKGVVDSVDLSGDEPKLTVGDESVLLSNVVRVGKQK